MPHIDPGDPAGLAREVRHGFERAFGRDPDVVGRAPGRVNLIGEHTDYNAGLCLPVALPHAALAALGRRDDHRVRIASRQQSEPWEGTLDDLGPGAVTGWATYVAGVLWALREAGHDVPGVDVLVDGRVPLGAGLSSSAALECSVAVAMAGLLGLGLSESVRRDLAAACVRAENEVAGARTGGMDQTVSLLAVAGSALLIDFHGHTTSTVPLDLADAGLTLLVTDTRVSHALSDAGEEGYAARRADCETAAGALGVVSLRHTDLAAVDALTDERARRRARHVVSENDRVRSAVDAIRAGRWDDVGRLFLDSHASMRDDFEISCRELDTVVTTAVEAGALGARMTGGGFGGSAISLVRDERRAAVVRAIDAAFAAAGFGPPDHLIATAAAGAGIVAPDPTTRP